jgi:rhodanese-related sulfurtransferase
MSDDDFYAGDVEPAVAMKMLEEQPGAVLVDVRTRPEWSFVGLPDLQSAGKEALLQEWQMFPTMQVDPQFADRLSARLAEAGVPPDAPVLFLCRSGARSRAAAMAMTAAGRTACFNISDGFEGPRNEEGHRGTVAGWKASGLPWVQS